MFPFLYLREQKRVTILHLLQCHPNVEIWLILSLVMDWLTGSKKKKKGDFELPGTDSPRFGEPSDHPPVLTKKPKRKTKTKKDKVPRTNAIGSQALLDRF